MARFFVGSLLGAGLVILGNVVACGSSDVDSGDKSGEGGAATSSSNGSGGNGTTTSTSNSSSTSSSKASSTTNASSSAASSGASGGMGGAATTASSSSGQGTGGAGGSIALPAPPQVVQSNPPGPVVSSPKVQLIAYASDTYLSDVEAAVTELSQTATWSQQTSEYGVGALTVLPTITIPGTPPATLDDNSGDPTPFEQTLVNNTSGANPAWGAADASTIYLFVLPQGTQIDSGGLCCDNNEGYFGYHWSTTVSGVDIPYAVVCNCANFVEPPLTALDDVTTTITHELAEAATDPFTNNPAFAQEDDAHVVWEYGSFGAEIADMCQNNTDSNYTPPGSTYMVQRSWSNAAALAGTNPCVPVPATGPYFNAYPVLPDMITINDYNGDPVTTQGVKIPVGQTKTIDILMHSEAPTSGPWDVAVYDLSSYIGDTAKDATQLTLDKTSGVDGDVLHLTIKVLKKDTILGGEGFVLESTLGGQDNLWYAAIGN